MLFASSRKISYCVIGRGVAVVKAACLCVCVCASGVGVNFWCAKVFLFWWMKNVRADVVWFLKLCECLGYGN